MDNLFDSLFFKEELIKESEKLPNNIKISLEKGKSIESEWDNKKKLNQLINGFIYIENDIKNINKINENINKGKSNKDLVIDFFPNEVQINDFLEMLKRFGNISKKSLNELNNNIEENNNMFPRREFCGWVGAP